MNINFTEVNKYRFKTGYYGTPDDCPYGAFLIPFRSQTLKVIATDGVGIKPEWEHVSVSCKNRCPNWEEMSFIKNLFWGEDETVIQFHPKKSEYVNQHPFVLHLWKRTGKEHELPPSIYVGSTP